MLRGRWGRLRPAGAAMVIWVGALAGVVAAKPAAADYAHCYDGPPPAGVVEASPALARSAMFLDFALLPVLYRKICGLIDDDDWAYVSALVTSRGCSMQSDLGRVFAKVLTIDLQSLEGLQEVDRVAGAYPTQFGEACTAVRDMPWPVYDRDLKPLSPEVERQAFASLEGIEQRLQRIGESYRACPGGAEAC